jgi:hypothetical protein
LEKTKSECEWSVVAKRASAAHESTPTLQQGEQTVAGARRA